MTHIRSRPNVSHVARWANCPSCGKRGLKRLLTNCKAYEYHHGHAPGPIGPQAVICIVKAPPATRAQPQSAAEGER